MTLSVTVERFFAISYPLERKNLKNGLIVFSVSAAALYNLPRFFELEKVEVEFYDEATKQNLTVSWQEWIPTTVPTVLGT